MPADAPPVDATNRSSASSGGMFLFIGVRIARSARAERLKLSHAGPMMSTAKAELKRPTGVGSSAWLGRIIGFFGVIQPSRAVLVTHERNQLPSTDTRHS